MGKISDFIERHYRHFNAATLVDAARAYKAHLAAGGKMMVTMAGAMSTAELGISLAEMIRRGKVHADPGEVGTLGPRCGSALFGRRCDQPQAGRRQGPVERARQSVRDAVFEQVADRKAAGLLAAAVSVHAVQSICQFPTRRPWRLEYL